MEVFFTIVAGVGVFTIGQLVLKLWIEPVAEFKALQVEVITKLKRDEGIIISSIDYSRFEQDEVYKQKCEELSNSYFDLSARISGNKDIIPLYSFVSYLSKLPNSKDLLLSSQNLNYIGNTLVRDAENSSVTRHKLCKEVLDIFGYKEK
ncbi:hypothetical protein [Kangiella spongicola]|uniref:Uncharacterized protein n=1 Tax=Kangiella spongicola TaxID=796379 RepID=A0A318D0I2_9GAMM|nr:hypothetical protein [Kangiella spongicola]PXF62706.1 hypothetical protein DL796_10295 [Kangiella spongicola]